VQTGTQPVDGAVAPDGLVWIPNLQDGTVTRIDPATAHVVGSLRVGAMPFVVNVAFGDVWAPDFGGRQVWRLKTS
jgi:streptogramin lyase